ncbi:dTDP-glucose 4,6-dehydratase [Cyanobium sp. Morenito 9A2]|uniref:dTDP-glucose 4,6-dehydratase n=1 Tax=Cyanobium sp. Morenito 9A2 TaxID=2823718 RepID=UPI0020CC5F9B|nr:dTDP-glucose 4,6-dehydratase [Cyanobium sp. Morenito 9A2]MCP9849763.1 dTDP-glucose 4,6-dehydratase [Cyanobium sp. Morenito 9A2]
MTRHILITGGAGFIAGNLVHHWAAAHPNDNLVVLDALTYAGNRATIEPLIAAGQIRFVEGDIGDRTLVDVLLAEHAITHIAHLAAESHVDRSISGPAAFLSTNVGGTFTLLEAFRTHWLAAGSPASWRFLHVSTDEVFGSLEPSDPPFNETTAYAPRSPYAASKAASDHLARAWQHTYGLPVLVSNCSNNYGPFHFPEKLIPLTLINILLGRPIPVYGDGANVRDWLFVEDHCRALERILLSGEPGHTYCIGGNNEVSNLDLVHQLCDLVDELASDQGLALPQRPSRELIRFVTDRPGHDRRYAIDASHIREALGWEPRVTVSEGLRRTVAWYLANRSWWEPLLSDDYSAYLVGQYAGQLS